MTWARNAKLLRDLKDSRRMKCEPVNGARREGTASLSARMDSKEMLTTHKWPALQKEKGVETGEWRLQEVLGRASSTELGRSDFSFVSDRRSKGFSRARMYTLQGGMQLLCEELVGFGGC